MKFQAIVAPTITELFEQQMQNQILSGQMKPGEKLPTEAELADAMRISKSAVHAGIKNLERMGFLKISPRHGVYIADYTECGNVDTLIALVKYYNRTLDHHTIQSLLEARDVLEGLATRKFIQICTGDDLAHLQGIINRFHSLGSKSSDSDPTPDRNTATGVDNDALAELACSFHCYICYKSGNNVIPLIVNGFHEVNIVLWARWIRQVGANDAEQVLRKFLHYITVKDADHAVELYKLSARGFLERG